MSASIHLRGSIGLAAVSLALAATGAACDPCGPTTFTGNVTIASAADATYWRCLQVLDGDLSVTSTAPALVELTDLEAVTSISVDYSQASGAPRFVDLPVLDFVSGHVEVKGTLQSGPLDVSMNALGAAQFGLQVDLTNTSSTAVEVHGLNGMGFVPASGDLIVKSAGSWNDFDFLNSLETAEYVRIESTVLDPTQGPPLRPRHLRLAIDVEVLFPPGLAPRAAFQMLPDLETVAGFFHLKNEPYYPATTFSFTRLYPNLTQAGLLQIEGSQLIDLDVGAATLDLMAMKLDGNSALQHLDRAGITIGNTGPITITNNPALRDCTAQAYVDALVTSGHMGTMTVSGNNPEPCDPCEPIAYSGDLVIDEPSDLPAAACVMSVSGSFTITDHPRIDFVSLPLLETIGGNASISYTMGAWQTHADKRSVQLPALTSVGGSLSASAQYSGFASAGLPFGMNALTSVGGDITLTASFGPLTGFTALTGHAGNITLTGPNLDVGGSGLMPNLATVGGNLHVEGYFAFIGFFPAVTSVVGTLTISHLRLMGGFGVLTTVGGDFVIDAPKFWFPPAALTTVGGSVIAQNGSPVATLNVSGAASTTAHGLTVSANATLSGLDSDLHITGAGPISIVDNPMLDTCAAQTYVAAQMMSGWTGMSTISGNGGMPCPMPIRRRGR
jgi:hypothetical protein